MTMIEKRKHSRTDSLNLINFIHFDENGDEGAQGMGRTLNVSPSGILLETHQEVIAGHIISLTIGLNNNVVEIKGLIKYTKETAAEVYESGIEFIDVVEEDLSTLNDYIAAFNSRSQQTT